MGFLRKLFNRKSETITKYQIVTERGNGIYIYSGKVYESDLVTSCIAPYKKAVGKLVPRHIRKGKEKTDIDPEPYIRFLLEDPNPLLSMQKVLEKCITPLLLSGNAFILIVRNPDGYPVELFPIPAVNVEAVYRGAQLHLKFLYENGRRYIHSYDDVIHLRTNITNNDLFGSPIIGSLMNLTGIVETIDTGIKKAVKNSNIIKWLIRFNSPMRSDDIRERANAFANSYLDVNNGQAGIIASDLKTDVTQVQPNDYVPNSDITASITKRIYSLLGVNEKIVQGLFNEDEWNSFYESSIEPIALDLQHEFTRKLFTRKERAYGNKIIFAADNLSCASVRTRLSFVQMVDRRSWTPNEWRDMFGREPLPGGDEPIMRLDTAVVSESVKGGDENKKD